MTTMTITPVKFHEQTLLTFEHNGEPHVVMKPIVEALGLSWNGQFERVRRNSVLARSILVTRTVAEDGKEREMIALPLKLLNGWLFGIDSSRVKPQIRATIETYQRECYDALYAYWHLGEAKNPRHAPDVKRRNRKAINSRAWQLAKQNFPAYKAMMLAAVPLDDPDAAVRIAEWMPPTVVEEAIALLERMRHSAALVESPRGGARA